MKKIKLLSIVLILIALFLAFNFFYEKESLASFTKKNTIIYLEIANTEKQREYGLMNQKFMPDNHGMLFIFDQPQHLSFWMKNTLIPLDMIFLNHHHIVAIYHNVPPCPKKVQACPVYAPNIDADEVVELNARVAEKLNFYLSEDLLLKMDDHDSFFIKNFRDKYFARDIKQK